MKQEKPYLRTYFYVPNPGLRAYCKRTEDGNLEDYRPPFWSGQSRESVLAAWQKEMDSLGIKETYPDLYQFEMDMKSKVGPMSIQMPLADRLESIEEYFTAIDSDSEPLDEYAVKCTIRYFSKGGGIRLRGRKRTMDTMKKSTNSGSPFFTKRKKVYKETEIASYTPVSSKGTFMQSYSAMPESSKDAVNAGESTYGCAILGWRGQEGGPKESDVKQRVVWMMPFLLNLEELRFYQPAIEAMQKNNLIPAYVSMDAVDIEVTRLFDTKPKDDDVICTDFKAFDQHFNKDMQDGAKKVEYALSSKDAEIKEWFNSVYNVKFTIPLICSEQIMYSGAHGMGSGSGGTNFDECMAHKVLQFEAAIRNHATLNPHSMAYGDDGILTYPGITVDQVIQTYTRHGQVMNPSKQYVSKHDCVVLRRWHGMDYRVNGIMVGVYSTFRALGRLLAQERFYDPDKWSATMVTLRALSILENCKWSPYFTKFVDFVMKGDKYQLGLGIPGFFENLEKTARKAMEEFDDFLGYTKNMQTDESTTHVGINGWSVVKYLKSKLH